MSDTPADSGGVTRQLKSFFSAAAKYIAARFKLAAAEGKEASAHALKLLLMGIAAVFVAAMGWIFICLAAVFLMAKVLGENGWLWASLIMAALHFAAALVIAKVLKAKSAEPMFPLTTEEFKKEQEWMERE
jgi:uncharacterized membrane protein YqjE